MTTIDIYATRIVHCARGGGLFKITRLVPNFIQKQRRLGITDEDIIKGVIDSAAIKPGEAYYVTHRDLLSVQGLKAGEPSELATLPQAVAGWAIKKSTLEIPKLIESWPLIEEMT